jgi:hypothetical protein
MKLNERQYERVGRYLDGEQIELAADERAVADEIRRMEAPLPAMLEAQPSRKATDRARRRMLSELLRPGRRTRRIIWPAAAAAAVLIAVTAVWVWRSDPPPPAPLISIEEVAGIYAGFDENVDLDIIAEELHAVEADIVISTPAGTLDAELHDLQETLDTFWLEEETTWPDEEAWPDGV